MKIKEGYPEWLVPQKKRIVPVPWHNPWHCEHHRICTCCGQCHECAPYLARPFWPWRDRLIYRCSVGQKEN